MGVDLVCLPLLTGSYPPYRRLLQSSGCGGDGSRGNDFGQYLASVGKMITVTYLCHRGPYLELALFHLLQGSSEFDGIVLESSSGSCVTLCSCKCRRRCGMAFLCGKMPDEVPVFF